MTRPLSLLATFGAPLLCTAVAALAVAADASRPAAAQGMRGRAEAMQAFHAQQYATAYGRFAELADAGDATAARMALMLVCDGPTAFGAEWSATAGQLRRWRALADRDLQGRAALIAGHERGE